MTVLKKILALILVVCMLASVLALTSCNKDKDEGNDNGDTNGDQPGTNDGGNDNTYTIKVVDGAGSPVAGVTVIVSPSFSSYTTGQDGKVSFESTDTGMMTMITDAPEGYEYSTDTVAFPTGAKELTLTVTKIADSTINYTVKVVDEAGNPVAGAELQICFDGGCLPNFFTTNANGEATASTAKNGLHVKIISLPEAYTAPTADSNGYHAEIPAGETTVTIVVTAK